MQYRRFCSTFLTTGSTLFGKHVVISEIYDGLRKLRSCSVTIPLLIKDARCVSRLNLVSAFSISTTNIRRSVIYMSRDMVRAFFQLPTTKLDGGFQRPGLQDTCTRGCKTYWSTRICMVELPIWLISRHRGVLGPFKADRRAVGCIHDSL